MDEIDTLKSSTDFEMEPLRPGQRHPVEASSGQEQQHEEDEAGGPYEGLVENASTENISIEK